MADFPLVGDVRGLGLFLGVELVRDRDSLEPAAAQASYVVNRMRDRGVLLSTDGPLHNVLKIKPPLPFSAADADRLVNVLRDVLAEDGAAAALIAPWPASRNARETPPTPSFTPPKIRDTTSAPSRSCFFSSSSSTRPGCPTSPSSFDSSMTAPAASRTRQAQQWWLALR